MALAECLDRVREGVSIRRPDVMFVRKAQAKVLPRGLASIVLTALRESDILLKQLIVAKNKEEFRSSRKKIFRDYVNLAFIISNSFSVAAAENPSIRQLATKEAFKLVEHILHAEGTPRLGCNTVREAIFCLDTLRRAHRIVEKLHSRGNVPRELTEKDHQLSSEFTYSALWAHLHLDCVRIIVRQSKGEVEKVVLDEILDGARSAVMAYSYARQGLELRNSQESYLLEGNALDAEDEELLQESYSDYVASESSNVEA